MILVAEVNIFFFFQTRDLNCLDFELNSAFFHKDGLSVSGNKNGIRKILHLGYMFIFFCQGTFLCFYNILKY